MKKSFIDQKSSQKRSLTFGNKKIVSSSLLKQKQKQKFKYYIGTGNNACLIRRIMSTRKQWSQTTDCKYLFVNFKWQQTNKSYKYQNCLDNKIFKQSLNHLEFHQQLSNKEYLFKNLQEYCESIKMNIFDIVPMTFILNFVDSTNFENSQNHFIKIYEANLPAEMANQHNRKLNLIIKRRKIITSNKTTIQTKSKYYTKYEINPEFKQPQNSKYLWILKPTFQNRGNGIHVFNNLQELQKLINHYLNGETSNGSLANNGSQTNNGTQANNGSQTTKSISNNTQTQLQSPLIKRKNFRIRDYTEQNKKSVTSFVIQKYLQKPLLFDGRKFDIRIWVLFTYDLKIYFFKQGYMRTSSYKYSTRQEQLHDLNIHLTNNAIQKNNKEYGKFEDGNQLSFKVFKNLIEKNGYNYNEVINKIKSIIKHTGLSIKKKINKNNRAFCMQIFGYDFILDQKCNPFLIEINTNPCIQQSSQLLSNLLPRMLDDALSLTIDRIFETDKKGYNYTIQNQYNTDNLWQFIVDLKKPSANSSQVSRNGTHQIILNQIQ